MEIQNICSVCKRPVGPSAPQGLCPECLLQAGLPTGIDMGPETQNVTHVPFVAPSLEEIARLFPQLEILSFIGQGGMGAVYQARQKTLDRIVALKILPPGVGKDPAFADRFTREAKALARLNHPGVVTLYEFGQASGLYFFIMEYVDGMNLRRLINTSRISPREALAIVPQICDALQFAHDQGIVHRDIKPENLLLDKTGRVKVADFGIAKMLGVSVDGTTAESAAPENRTQSAIGTPRYSAPEQKMDPTHVDSRADIYSLGMVFYEMLTGELPGKNIELPSRKVCIDVRLDEVVLRALEKQPALRFQQASEVKTAVETIQAPPIEKPQPAPMPPSASWEEARARVRPWTAMLITLGALGLAFLLLISVSGFSFSSNEVTLNIGAFGTCQIPLRMQWYAMWRLLYPLILIFNILVLLGGLKMRNLQNYGLAVAGAVSAIFALPLLPFGIPVGIGTLSLLRKKEIRREFGPSGKLADARMEISAPQFGKLAIASFLVTVVSLLNFWVQEGINVLGMRPQGDSASSWVWLTLATVFAVIQNWGSLGTVCLAEIAAEDILRAKGQLKGAGFATFALLFLPIFSYLPMAIRWMAPPDQTMSDLGVLYLLASAASLVLCGGLGFWMHRIEARLNDPSIGERLIPRRALRTSQCIAAVLFVLALYQGEWKSYWHRMAQPVESLSESARNVFAAHAIDHRLPSQEKDFMRFSAALPKGEVILLAVSDITSPTPICWRPDGALLCGATNTAANGDLSHPRQLVLSLYFPDSFSDHQILPFELKIDGKEAEAIQSTSSEDGAFIYFSAPANASFLDFKMAQPTEQWIDTDAGWAWNGQVPRHPERNIHRSGQDAIVTLGQVSEFPKIGTYIGWMRRSFPKDWIERMVAVDASGIVHEPVEAGAVFHFNESTILRDVAKQDMQLQGGYFTNLPPASIKEVRLQICKCQWVEYHNVSLQPAHRTQVEIVNREKK